MSQQDTPQIIEGPTDPDLWERWKRERDVALGRRIAAAIERWERMGLLDVMPPDELKRYKTAARTGVHPDDVPL